MRRRLDGFFDGCVGDIRSCVRRIDTLGPSPDEP
jgi:hypothetical protein